MSRFILAALSCLTLSMSGCAIVELGLRNPVPGLETVAIVPFFNLSQDRTVDGREFALAYYSELQKVPGFEVLPVGVAERAIFENQLEMAGPEDALTLAKILDVDAVVVGAVTDFDAYNPRIGLKISWYSPQQWLVLPNRPGKPKLLPSLVHVDDTKRGVPVLRAQSPDAFVLPDEQWMSAEESDTDNEQSADSTEKEESPWDASSPKVQTAQTETPETETPAPREFLPPIQSRPLRSDVAEVPPAPPKPETPPLPIDILMEEPMKTGAKPGLSATPSMKPPAAKMPVRQSTDRPDPFADLKAAPDRMLIPRRRQPETASQNTVPALVYDEDIVMPATDAEFDPHEPLMAYVRIFDSTDRRLVARLADYLELSGESRSGDLEAWMQRSEFFRKFTAHVMISEMLTLHGGESRRRLVLKPREYQ